MPLLVPLGFAQLLAHLTPDQVRVAAAYHFDGQTQEQLADRYSVTTRTIRNWLTAVDETCDLFGVPHPSQGGPDSRHVRTLDEDMMRSL
jgi:hypothetical protein